MLCLFDAGKQETPYNICDNFSGLLPVISNLDNIALVEM